MTQLLSTLRKLLRLPRYLIIHLFFRPYYMFRYSWPVWFYMLNKEGRMIHRGYPIQLSAIQRRLIADLKETGIAIIHIDELFPEQNFLPKFQLYVESLLHQAKVQTDTPSVFNLWDYKDDHVLDFENPLLRFSLTPPVLGVVNGYLEMASKLLYYQMTLAKVVDPRSQALGSQRWHRDPEDKKHCKLFLYLTDVDESSGPFMYVCRSHYGGKWSGLFPRKFPKGIYPQQGEVEKNISAKDVKICIGRAGTMIFCDTGGFHKGGYAIKNERLMFNSVYSSKGAVFPIRYRYPPNFSEEFEKLDKAAKFAVDKNYGVFVGGVNRIMHFSRRNSLF